MKLTIWRNVGDQSQQLYIKLYYILYFYSDETNIAKTTPLVRHIECSNIVNEMLTFIKSKVTTVTVINPIKTKQYYIVSIYSSDGNRLN